MRLFMITYNTNSIMYKFESLYSASGPGGQDAFAIALARQWDIYLVSNSPLNARFMLRALTPLEFSLTDLDLAIDTGYFKVYKLNH